MTIPPKPQGLLPSVGSVPTAARRSAGSPVAEEILARRRWQSLLDVAEARWPAIPFEELLAAGGNRHRLAGLVQLRQRMSREESDREVKAFFDQHEPTA